MKLSVLVHHMPIRHEVKVYTAIPFAYNKLGKTLTRLGQLPQVKFRNKTSTTKRKELFLR
jgi:hypothetical protein